MIIYSLTNTIYLFLWVAFLITDQVVNVFYSATIPYTIECARTYRFATEANSIDEEVVHAWENAPFDFYQNWNVDTRKDFGKESTDIVNDPADPSSGTKVMRVFYQQGSYSKTKHFKGLQFYSRPISPKTCLTLEYKLFFADNFDFVKGGKLPGLWGGSLTCSGGRDAVDCFSTRFMWRRDGVGAVYTYVPDNQQSGFCDRPRVKCNFDYGHDLGRNWSFEKSRWQTLSQTVHLNTVGQADGSVVVKVDNTEVLNMADLVFRNSPDVQIEGIFFSTFFGGGSPSWASTADTYTYYKDFKLTEC